MTPEQIEHERGLFQKWFRSIHMVSLRRNKYGDYINTVAQEAWGEWLARAELAAKGE